MASGSPRAIAKRQQIMTAARGLFLADGYARTSMDAVTAAAGVSKQTLYAYFPAKEELLREMLFAELHGLRLDPPDGTSIRSTDDLRDFLTSRMRSVIDTLMTPDAIALLRLVIGEAAQLPTVRGLFRAALPIQVLSGMTLMLTGLDKAGVVRIDRPDLSARMLLGPMMSFIALDGWMSDAEPMPPSDADLAAIVDLFLRTLAAEGQR